jgi:UDP-2-acetamido-2,6-beta-L-arabino-hexul-4-ose reductase
VIRLRNIQTEEVTEYYVNGDKQTVVDIPPGYTHSIVNLGDTDMITLIWANESFHNNMPDTYYMEV